MPTFAELRAAAQNAASSGAQKANAWKDRAKRRRIDVDGLEGGRGSLRGTPTPMTPERLAMDIALGSRPPSVALGTPPEGFGEKVEDGSFEGSPGLGADVVQMALVIANPDHQQ
ncbi:hypothetical protein BT69DRAFT_1301366 [Atractiella rhizophila]|nr:hypothetical protein BT69DRAFT_1301366 [Atractiella rhizophila]